MEEVFGKCFGKVLVVAGEVGGGLEGVVAEGGGGFRVRSLTLELSLGF